MEANLGVYLLEFEHSNNSEYFYLISENEQYLFFRWYTNFMIRVDKNNYNIVWFKDNSETETFNINRKLLSISKSLYRTTIN